MSDTEINPMRTMGLDVGTKTVGVALSDELGMTAQPLRTLFRTSTKKDLAALQDIAREYGVGHVVIGLPLNMNGSEGPRAKASREFGDALAAHSKMSVEFWDERLTTVAAQRILLEADVSRERRKKVVDTVAAVLILQGWMDAHAVPYEEPEDLP